MNSTNNLTKSSILISLNVILFIFCKIFNIADLTLLTICSMITCFSLIKFNIRYSLLIVIGSTISSIIFGLVEYSLMYVLFFGSYPIIKFHIEKLNHIIRELILKFIYFNSLFIIIFLLYIKLFLPIKINIILIIIGCIFSSVIFLIYDIMLTRIIRFIYINPFLKNL